MAAYDPERLAALAKEAAEAEASGQNEKALELRAQIAEMHSPNHTDPDWWGIITEW